MLLKLVLYGTAKLMFLEHASYVAARLINWNMFNMLQQSCCYWRAGSSCCPKADVIETYSLCCSNVDVIKTCSLQYIIAKLMLLQNVPYIARKSYVPETYSLCWRKADVIETFFFCKF
jgi:hypothetical protein